MFWGRIHYKDTGELLYLKESLDADGYVNLLDITIPEIKKKPNIRSFTLQVIVLGSSGRSIE